MDRAPPAERSGLRQFCLHLVLTKSPPPPPVVASQLLSTLAVLLKRAWLDPDADRGAMLAEAEAAVAQASTTAARRTGLQLFTVVIAEFSPTTASPMNLPWDFHERCRASLETDFLRQFFSHGAGVARSVAESGAALAGADEGVCVAALRLMCTALAWDFSRGGNGAGAASGGFGFAGPGPGSARGGGDEDAAAKIAPGPAWREPLLAPGALDWLFTLHATTNARVRGESSGVGAVAATAAATRSALASLCAISGDVFPSGAEDPGETTRRAHFARCASALSGALRPAKEAVAWAARGAGEEALVDGARSLASLAATHPPADFLAPLPPAPGADGGATGAQSQPPTLGILGELTLECLAAGSLTVEAEGTAAEDVTRMLMEAWSSLVERSAWRPGASLSPPGEGAVPPEITQGCAQVFQAYLQAGLAAAAAAAYDEDDGQEEEGQAGAAALDERLGLAAAVARAAPDATLPLLRAAAEAKKNALSAAAGAGRDPSVPLEELWWVSRLIPHVLADPFEGEIPLPPDAVAECSNRAALANAESPVDALSSEYIALACLCLDDAARRVVSPRLMETLCWGAARWADTYLMPEDTGGSVHAALLAGRTMGLGADDGGEGRVYRGSNKAKPASFSEAGEGSGRRTRCSGSRSPRSPRGREKRACNASPPRRSSRRSRDAARCAARACSSPRGDRFWTSRREPWRTPPIPAARRRRRRRVPWRGGGVPTGNSPRDVRGDRTRGGGGQRRGAVSRVRLARVGARGRRASRRGERRRVDVAPGGRGARRRDARGASRVRARHHRQVTGARV